MKVHLFLYGLGIWIAATLVLRVRGLRLLYPGHPVTIILLFAVSFVLMALLARRLCRASGLTPAEWPAGAISLALPTLLLDPFSSAFFAVVFPNMPPEASGVFGGWMLICCGGAVVGAIIPPNVRA